jgi:hypothetical protein
MEHWRTVWRIGLARYLNTKGLVALRDALREDDTALTQGGVVFAGTGEEKISRADAIGYALWKGENLRSPDEVRLRFYEVGRKCDQNFRDQDLWVENFTEWFDSIPRGAAFAALLQEVEETLSERDAK